MTPVGSCLMFVVYSALLVLFSLPMALGKVPPNASYGFRTPKTLRDPTHWKVANRVAGRNMMAAGLLGIATAIAALLLGLPDWLNVVALSVGVVLACSHATWFVRRL